VAVASAAVAIARAADSAVTAFAPEGVSFNPEAPAFNAEVPDSNSNALTFNSKAAEFTELGLLFAAALGVQGKGYGADENPAPRRDPGRPWAGTCQKACGFLAWSLRYAQTPHNQSVEFCHRQNSELSGVAGQPFTRRRKEKLVFDAEDAGKTAYVCARYENGKGETGRWGPVVSAIIP
jgi:hypothetical protein